MLLPSAGQLFILTVEPPRKYAKIELIKYFQVEAPHLDVMSFVVFF